MDYSKGLTDFIARSPSCYHVIESQCNMLCESGYTRLSESDEWTLSNGGRYFVTRNDSSVIAFRIPENGLRGFRIMASHSDSPTFKIKPSPEIKSDGKYVKLNVELYGGALIAPWFDRSLSVAGRIFVRTEHGIERRLVSIDRDLLSIPSLAIHMNPQANDGYKYSIQKDCLPLYGGINACTLRSLIAGSAGVREDDIVSDDLFLVCRSAPSFWGADGEFMSSPRLDDVQCAYSSLCGLIESFPGDYCAVHAVFDNEEVGSSTRQGAASTFLQDVILRIAEAFSFSHGKLVAALSDSFMASADNAHAVHPNYAEKADPVNHPYLNGGVVLKYSANQRYCTDGASAAKFYDIAGKAGIPTQVFVNNSDVRGGSTLGNISLGQVSVCTADIGVAQLAMHSPYETCGAYDTERLVAFARTLFSE